MERYVSVTLKRDCRFYLYLFLGLYSLMTKRYQVCFQVKRRECEMGIVHFCYIINDNLILRDCSPKNVIIFSPSCCSKPVLVSFFFSVEHKRKYFN